MSGKDIRYQDVKNKRAAYISKNNDILQEFNFAHPSTRAELNKIQNSHFYGSVLWNLCSKEAVQLEKTWNVSVRRMFDLPRETHCYLVEAVSQQDHVKTILSKRFLNFIQSIRSSQKQALKDMLKVVEHDTLSVTGMNLRTILLQTQGHSVQDLRPSDANIKYRDIPAMEEYRVEFIREIVDIKNSQLEVQGFSTEELDDILQHLCVS